MVKKTMKILAQFYLLSFLISTAVQSMPLDSKDRFSPVMAKHGMVVTEESLASQIGLKVLQQGGNAIDAAVTIGFVMAVTYPSAGNIGGGGFMLVHLAESKQIVAIDYRETAPTLAHKDMFLNEARQVDYQLSQFSHLAAGVPGTVAGLTLALEKYGTFPLEKAIAPAIELAEQGFIVTPWLSQALLNHKDNLEKNPAAQAIFFKESGQLYQTGDLFIQTDLANTLKIIAKEGIQAFYQGKIAELIVTEMEANHGLISKADLAKYKPIIREAVVGNYRGYEIYSMPLPSSGGIHIIQILNILEKDDIQSLGHNSAATIHIMSEAMKRAYADRSKYLGDADFVKVPVAALISKNYAIELRTKIPFSLSNSGQQLSLVKSNWNNLKATPSKLIAPGKLSITESDETTHYSVIDQAGNAVANTYTLNFSFGSGIMVANAGFLLNNEMDDFSAKPGVPNAYGLIGNDANSIVPHKRMLSSMSPTIVLKAGKPFLITGSPGGSRIITTTLQVIMNVIDHQMNIQEAVNAIRIHHQWLPDELRVEEGLNIDTLNLLTNIGHKIKIKKTMGAASSILIDPNSGVFFGAVDPRKSGLAIGF
ncbi:MAG: gamma-glutamyltransferase [Thiomargarita sp.]|nr:gamma-glutamyltransferase [Thiomargarita sp.]